jgi:hypothetical protein
MNYNRLGQIGKSWTNRILRATYPNTLTARWETVSEDVIGEYDDATGRYVDPVTRVPVTTEPDKHELQIAAYFDQSRDAEFRYAKYGVNAQTDLVAIIPDDTILPGTGARYYRAGDPHPYKLRQHIDRADIGVPDGGSLPETAYKVIHFTRGDVS